MHELMWRQWDLGPSLLPKKAAGAGESRRACTGGQCLRAAPSHLGESVVVDPDVVAILLRILHQDVPDLLHLRLLQHQLAASLPPAPCQAPVGMVDQLTDKCCLWSAVIATAWR
jgi:hypothetical protein